MNTATNPENSTSPMLAYHNKRSIKTKFLKRVQAHQRADELVQGYGYWQDGKGCAVGCTIHSGDHAEYETEMGIPRAIARIEDGLFERMPVDSARTWPERFLEAIPVGADLSQVVDKFLHWLLVDPEEGVIKFARTEKARRSISAVGELFARKLKGETITREEWVEVRKAAYADAAAYAYADAYADAAAYAAAYAYADAAAYAYADAAAYAYAYADAAYAYAYAYARKQAALRQAEKLLELLRSAPVITPALT